MTKIYPRKAKTFFPTKKRVEKDREIKKEIP
jgi:hypothetical protein